MYTTLDISLSPTIILTTFEETLEALKDIIKRHGAQAWLFGSRATGKAGEHSDIDIAVSADDFDTIEEEIADLDTVFEIDLVDLSYPHVKEIEYGWISLV